MLGDSLLALKDDRPTQSRLCCLRGPGIRNACGRHQPARPTRDRGTPPSTDLRDPGATLLCALIFAPGVTLMHRAAFGRAEPTIIPTWPDGIMTCSPSEPSLKGAILSCSATRCSGGRRLRRPCRRRATVPARQIFAEQIFDEFRRRGVGKGFALVGPFLQLDETAGFGACGIEPRRNRRTCARCAGVERPECGLQHFHRKRAELPRRGLRVTQSLQCSADALG